MLPKTKLILTNNALKDIVEWLKEGYFICLHTKDIWKYYYKTQTKDYVKDELLIYIDLTNHPELVCEDEWPWYILNEGFSRYTSSYVLPMDPDNIHHFVL